jgi:hypothetical protein
MRSNPGSAPSSARTFWPSHRMSLFERLFDRMSTPRRMRSPLGLVANTPAVSGLSFKLVHRDV